MVQKRGKPAAPAKIEATAPPRRRGRPRAYEPDIALGKALDLFRKGGFAATSLDDLSTATGMNRPSLYGAFGDKRELYIKSYQRYRDDARAATTEIFRGQMPIRQRLARIYAIALDIYLSGDSGPRGCFTVMTAASEAVADPDIRAMVVDALVGLDKAFAICFQRAKESGELPRPSPHGFRDPTLILEDVTPPSDVSNRTRHAHTPSNKCLTELSHTKRI